MTDDQPKPSKGPSEIKEPAEIEGPAAIKGPAAINGPVEIKQPAKQFKAGVAVGIGSAAIVAALLYARSAKPKKK